MNKVTLERYRCFDSLTLEFSDKVNLLIGDNGSGKTTVIRGVSAALNSFFTGFSDANTRFTGLVAEDFRVNRSDDSLANEEPIRIGFEWLGVSSSLELHSAKGRTLTGPMKAIRDLGREYYKGLFTDGKQVLPLPLITSFSTADIHKPRKFGTAIFKKYDHKPSFGYFECFQGDGFMKYWTQRLLALKEADLGETEIEGVRSALLRALGDEGCGLLHHMDIRPIKGRVFFHLSDGRVTDTENLSDGLRRLVNIVMDMGFRCMLLNKGVFGKDACTETHGTVLIDEVDLHLHPALQSKVLSALQGAFPKIQFIATSHAPLVMSGIRSDEGNRIVKLAYGKGVGYAAKVVNAYGLDASTIIQSVLGVAPRARDVDDMLKALFSLIDDDRFEKASSELRELQRRFGSDLPELARAETMLNFLMASAHDSDR
jgi:hypothetical protein